MQNHASLTRTLHEAKATLRKFEDQFNRVTSENLDVLLRRLDENVEAMDVSDKLALELEQEITRLSGSVKWAAAMEITYAPNDLDGYHRVAEYYRRLDAVRAL